MDMNLPQYPRRELEWKIERERKYKKLSYIKLHLFYKNFQEKPAKLYVM